MLASNVNNRMAELRAVLSHSDVPEQHRDDLAFAMMIGKQGFKPPWPPGPTQAAHWQTKQVLQLLHQAEVLVISPAAHAAVMAAAATLEPSDVATLDKDRDILIPAGLLVLPEQIIVENRNKSLSDIRAFGWQPVTQHQILPTAQYPGIPARWPGHWSAIRFRPGPAGRWRPCPHQSAPAEGDRGGRRWSGGHRGWRRPWPGECGRPLPCRAQQAPNESDGDARDFGDVRSRQTRLPQLADARWRRRRGPGRVGRHSTRWYAGHGPDGRSGR
ncbi:hypothetical protein AB0D46_35370 [Streptomyces sp. NPDC048383]|uniref:hypothetical protein n=1 Tax=Streptomyces sp. NPDC048383 TaxID=3155386 RepID=UPI0034357E8C